MRDEAGQIVSRCLPCSLPNDRYLGYYGVGNSKFGEFTKFEFEYNFLFISR
jgi:hypothetical protein